MGQSRWSHLFLSHFIPYLNKDEIIWRSGFGAAGSDHGIPTAAAGCKGNNGGAGGWELECVEW